MKFPVTPPNRVDIQVSFNITLKDQHLNHSLTSQIFNSKYFSTVHKENSGYSCLAVATLAKRTNKHCFEESPICRLFFTLSRGAFASSAVVVVFTSAILQIGHKMRVRVARLDRTVISL